MKLTQEQASHFARLALAGIHRQYPNKLDHVINGEEDLLSPRVLHPAFYGCFDWHSAVHGHWMLVRLVKTMPDLPEEGEICASVAANLTGANLAAERAYLEGPNRRSFERTYGWAWLLKLAEEFYTWDHHYGREWWGHIEPLADAFAQRYLDFLPAQTYPIRTGTHPNTAFGLVFALEYARTLGRSDLEQLVVQRSTDYYGEDHDYPARWEPNGNDFLSPSLVEADLMRRVLPSEEFRGWLDRFLPGLSRGEPASLFRPAIVSDRTDPQIVHLDGLNLSRAWCMAGIASDLPSGDRARGHLLESARLHLEAALPHIASGDYMGEHWLASFAVYALSSAGSEP